MKAYFWCRFSSNILRKFLAAFSLIAVSSSAYADSLISVKPDSLTSSPEEDVTKPENTAQSLNLDLQALYGQYNSMYSAVNLAQEQRNFVYLLSSSFKRSNDYGYGEDIFVNSSYFENKISFTGNLNVTPFMKTILDVSIDSDSHGMFSNPDFSREEKERLDLSLKNIHKISPKFEVFYAFGGAYYSHQLSGKSMDDVRTRFSRYNGETGWEYIWSSSNRLRAKASYTKYHYSIGDQDDYYFARGEIIDDFYITNNFAFLIGLNFAYHKNFGILGLEDMRKTDLGNDIPIIPIGGISLKGIKYFSASLEYRYDMAEFKPEEYYFPQKYLYPAYYLIPSRVHRISIDSDFTVVDRFSLRFAGVVKKSDNYANYKQVSFSSDEASLLTAETVKADTIDIISEANLVLVKDSFDISASYTKFLFDSDKNITYKPSNDIKVSAKYYGSYFNITWINRFVGSRYVDPEEEEKIKSFVLGSLSVQYKASKSVFADLLIENLYNRKYYLRKGYPESGVTALFGLRVLI